MNLTILEDRPYNMIESIDKMQEMGIRIKNMVYFNPKNDTGPAEGMSWTEQELAKRDVKIITVDNSTFKKELDGLYEEEDMVFFFDMDLLRDYSLHFLERINVQYALERKEQEGNEGKIWFYTTGPRSAIEQIRTNFPHRYIPILEFKTKEDQVILDYDYIKQHVLK